MDIISINGRFYLEGKEVTGEWLVRNIELVDDDLFFDALIKLEEDLFRIERIKEGTAKIVNESTYLYNIKDTESSYLVEFSGNFFQFALKVPSCG